MSNMVFSPLECIFLSKVNILVNKCETALLSNLLIAV